MKSFFVSLLLAIVCLSSTLAFSVRPSVVPSVAVAGATSTSLNVFGKRKTKEQQAEEDAKYWQGEWVCKDCGYIYNKVGA
jgi:hypothetical protein